MSRPVNARSVVSIRFDAPGFGGARRGAASVAELVVVVWLFAFILVALMTFVAHQRRLASGQRDLLRYQEARRTVEAILGTEFRWLAPGDVAASGTDAVRARAVRGGGPVCLVDNSDVVVRYAGARRPNPSKDSILLVHSRGEAVREVRAVAGASGCGEGALRITPDRPFTDSAGFALIFEPGSYHGSGGALRYELGGAGRQPLTEAVFGEAGSVGFAEGSGLVLDLAVNPDSLPAAPGAVELRLRMLNALPEGEE